MPLKILDAESGPTDFHWSTLLLAFSMLGSSVLYDVSIVLFATLQLGRILEAKP